MLTLVLIIVLFPPSVLALISNNAVPGDTTYPIKRKLEDGILLIVSVNPTTRAWFSANRSTRRFDEARILIAQGKQTAGASLEELVSQTVVAAKEIDQISDPVQKEQLKQQLSQSIAQYSLGLNEIQKQIQSGQPEVVSQVTPLPITKEVITTPRSEASPQTIKTPMPSISQLPKPTQAAQLIQPTAQPIPTVAPTVVPTSQPAILTSPVSSDKLSEIQKQLKEIQDNLHSDDSKKTKENKDKTKKDEKEKSDQKEVPEPKESRKNK